MIYFDVTKAGRSEHRSGLMRVSDRLRAALGDAVVAVTWEEGLRDFRTGDRIAVTPADWLLTAEVFAEDERPGFGEFIRSGRVRTAAIFHDAIPLKFPQITWPQSVARHPGYMKMLGAFDRVWAVSHASREELIEKALTAYLEQHPDGTKDLPVEWRNAPDSRVHIIRDSWRMLADALQVRRRVDRALKNEG